MAALLGFLLLWGGIGTKPLSAMEKMAESIRKDAVVQVLVNRNRPE